MLLSTVTAQKCWSLCCSCDPPYIVYFDVRVEGDTESRTDSPEQLTVCVNQKVYFNPWHTDDYDTRDDCTLVADSIGPYEWDTDGDGNWGDPAPTGGWSRSAPGTYMVGIHADDSGTGPCCQDEWEGSPVQCVGNGLGVSGPCDYIHIKVVDCSQISLRLTSPANGAKFGWSYTTGYRERRKFYVTFTASLTPADLGGQVNLAVYWKKGGVENSAQMEHLGSGAYRYRFDVTERFTEADSSGVSNRYQVRATVTCGTCTLEAPEKPYFCILKGQQIVRVAEDFVHYPYHWGAKGPNLCSNDSSHGTPIDGTTWHEPYDNDNHPTGSAAHPCCLDCSGYVYSCYRICGISVPQGPAREQCATLPSVQSPKTGDVMCYCCDSQRRIHHITIRGSSGCWHAPQTGEWTKHDDQQTASSYAGPSGWGWCMDSSCSH